MNYPSELLQTYDVYDQIGAGGGGIVYRGFHKRLQKEVVIKRLKGTASTSLQDCRTEVNILKELRHSYLPQVHDFFDSAEGIFTVMDFIKGQSLQNMIDKGHHFTEKEVLKYTRQLCEALNYLHSQNPPIVHGDIKPDNIMITPEGNVCLIDFNISGILEGKGAVTFGYTQGFSAPEQVEAFHKLKDQMQKNKEQKKLPIEKNNKKTMIQQSNEKEKTMLLKEDKTVLLSEKLEKTILLADNNDDKTVLLTEGDDKTILLQEEQTYQEVAITDEKASSEAEVSLRNNKIKGIHIDKRSDVFSLGATIYTLLTGKFYDPKDKKVEYPNISDGFCIVLEKSLANAPGKRYQDAGKMLQAITEVHKKDKRYKRLIRRQVVFVLFMLICTGASTVVSYRGYQILGQESAQEFHTKSMDLYEQRAYEECLSFLLKEALVEESIYDRGELGNLYYLAAECFFHLEEYEAAVSYYKKAIIYNADSAEYYCNYAISLARLGKEQEASEVIATAVERGIMADQVYLMQGELYIEQEQFQQAIDSLEQCIQVTKDSYILARAYMAYSDIFANTDDYIKKEEILQKNSAVLERAAEALESSYRPFALERLVEAQGALYDLTRENSYAENAIAYAKQMKELGWDTFHVYVNLGMLYENMGQYVDSYNTYQECLNKYGENYVVYKKMAFLEIAVQEELPVKERSYESFKEYYIKAMELYENTGKQKDQDTELSLLEDNYKALEIGGWIK